VSYTRDWSSDRDVRAQLFRFSDGATLAEFPVANSSSAEERGSSVTMSPDGQFAIAWEEASDRTGGMANGRPDIFLNRYNASGSFIAQTRITATPQGESAPSVATDRFGNLVVAWQQTDLSNANVDIQARRLSSGGSLGAVLNIATGPDLQGG